MFAPAWVADAVFYQVFPDRFLRGNTRGSIISLVPWHSKPTRTNFFGGDLLGITKGLDYIQELGFTALYLNPIFAAGTNHRYDTSDYFAIDQMLGTDADFDRLVSEVHARGMRLVLDGVFNHCGTGFQPFRDVLANGEKSLYQEWFTVYSWPIVTDPVPNYATCGGVGYLPRLNTASAEVEQFIHEVALHWLGRGIDGWRLDVAYEVDPQFWRRFRSAIKLEYPNAYLIAEEWRDASPLVRGDTFDGAMHYELRQLAFDFVLTNALTGEAFSRALETLMSRYPAGSEFGMLTTLGTHDTARILSTCDENEEAVKLLFALLFTMPGAPMVYYGDEIGMSGQDDPDCRRAMEWDDSKWRDSIRATVRSLVALRRSRPSLRRGTTRVTWACDRAIAIERSMDEERSLIVLNNSRIARDLCFELSRDDDQLVLTNCMSGERFSASSTFRVSAVKPYEFLVFDVVSESCPDAVLNARSGRASG